MLKRVYSLETEFGLIHWLPPPAAATPLPADKLYEQLEAYLLAQGPYAVCDPTRTRAARPDDLVEVKEGFFLQQGARIYADTGHLEWAAPESADPLQALVYDRSADSLLAEALHASNAALPHGRIVIIKNNIDYKGNSFGCHENYSVRLHSRSGRDIREQICSHMIAFLVTRLILCGAGRIGRDNKVRDGLAEPPAEPTPFQLSQRADFITTVSSVDTRNHRPIVNMRDEPLADTRSFARLHLILGDSNMAQYSNLLKLGTTGLMLDMLESGASLPDIEFADPIETIRAVSADPSCRRPLRLANGDTMTAVDVQFAYWQAARDFVQTTQPEDDLAYRMIGLWERTLRAIRGQSAELAITLDWAIKRHQFGKALEKWGTDWDEVGKWDYLLDQTRNIPAFPVGADIPWDKWAQSQIDAHNWQKIEAYRHSYGLAWTDYQRQHRIATHLRVLDLRYHEIDPENGLFYQLSDIETVVDEAQVEMATRCAPESTRAHVRARAMTLAQQTKRPIRMDWHYICREGGKREVHLPDPLNNDSTVLEALFDLQASRPTVSAGGASATKKKQPFWRKGLLRAHKVKCAPPSGAEADSDAETEDLSIEILSREEE